MKYSDQEVINLRIATATVNLSLAQAVRYNTPPESLANDVKKLKKACDIFLKMQKKSKLNETTNSVN